MKRLVLLSLLCLASFALCASPSFGYGVAPYGEVGEENYLGVEAKGVVSFTSFHHKGDLELSLRAGAGDQFFKGVGAHVSTSLLEMKDHPFSRFFYNTALWEPTVGVGGEWLGADDFRFSLYASPLVFAQASFKYEFFSPYAFTSDFNVWGWGVTVFRVTVFPGGAR